MKTAFMAALFGALLAVSYANCPPVAYHACVKEEKPTKCKAVQVCETPYKEPCGGKYCEYPYACASLQKKECVGFLALKEKCGAPKKVCKEIKTPCGTGACGANQDCIKETTCVIKKVTKGRKLMTDKHSSAKVSGSVEVTGYGSGEIYGKADTGGYKKPDAYAYGSDAYSPYLYGCGNSYGSCGGQELICGDSYKCVAKEPCKDIVVKKCVKSAYKPGIDLCYGGKHFHWYALNAGELCGHEYCGYGYECAEVIIQKCKTTCGKASCGYGYECIEEYADKDCDKYAYLAAICKDVYEPICVPLPATYLLKYKPPCKTIYKCETQDSVCGNKYCPAGYVCAVDYKKTCGGSYFPVNNLPVVSKPVPYPKPVYTYVVPVVKPAPKPVVKPAPDVPVKKDSASLSITGSATPYGTDVTIDAASTGKGSTHGEGYAATKDAESYAAAKTGSDGVKGVIDNYSDGYATATSSVDATHDDY